MIVNEKKIRIDARKFIFSSVLILAEYKGRLTKVNEVYDTCMKQCTFVVKKKMTVEFQTDFDVSTKYVTDKMESIQLDKNIPFIYYVGPCSSHIFIF